MKTLLEKANEIKFGRSLKNAYTEEDLELVLAWFNRKITGRQLSEAKGLKSLTGNYLYYCASVLKRYIEARKIKIIKL